MASGAIAGVIGRGVGFGAQYLFLALVGRLLGATGAAPLYALLAAATVVAVIGRAGLDRFGLREIAAAVAAGRAGIARRLILRLLALQLVWTAVLVTATFALRQPLAAALELGSPTLVALLGAVTVGLVLTFSLAEYVLAFRSVFASAMVKSIIPYGLAAVLIAVALLRGTPSTAASVAMVLLAGSLLATIAGAALIARKTAGGCTDGGPLPALEIGRSVALAAVPLLMLGMTGLDVVLLQASHPGAETSFYQAAQRTAMTLTLGLVGINAIAAPLIAGAFATGRNEELGDVVRRASRWSLLQATPIAVLLMVSGRWVLRLFGADFGDGYPVLLILIAAQLINSATGPVVQLFIMTGKERVAFLVLLPVVVVTIPCYYLVGRSLGAVGVAVVTVVAFAAWNGALVLLAKRRFDIWSHADNVPCAAVFIAAAAALATFVTAGELSAVGLLLVVAAAAGMWRFGLSSEDRVLLRGAATRRLQAAR